jgi:chromosome segregation ATPase
MNTAVASKRVYDAVEKLKRVAGAYRDSKSAKHVASWMDDIAGLLLVLLGDREAKETQMAAVQKILAAAEAKLIQTQNDAAKAKADWDSALQQLQSQLTTEQSKSQNLQAQVDTLSKNQLQPEDVAELAKAATTLGLDPTTGDPVADTTGADASKIVA